MMRVVMAFFISGFCLIVLRGFKDTSPDSIGFDATLGYFKIQSQEFSLSAFHLQSTIAAINGKEPKTIIAAKNALKQCRVQYKTIEYFLEYFFKGAAVFFNGPPKFEVEEPFMEWHTPTGLQVMETLLYDPAVDTKKPELIEQIDAVYSSAKDLNSLLYEFTASDKQIMESIRLELIRIYTLGLSGFDAPSLKSGITESYAAFYAIKKTLQPYLQMQMKYADSVAFYLNSSMLFLDRGGHFDEFDRLEFLTHHGLRLQHYLGLLIDEMHLFQNTNSIVNYRADHLFSPDALNIGAFPNAGIVETSFIRELGRNLFFEKALSGNNKISCATCHRPELHFSDALPKSIAFDGHSKVQRNAASLLYAGFQHELFWEGRAKSIEEQVRLVFGNHSEMNGDFKNAVQKLHDSKKYRLLFSKAFPEEQDSLVTSDRIVNAIAVFVRNLNPRNSPFDRYMQGDSTALTVQQKKGFNLFMGKAQCGTCHFAPLFNGLVPPQFNISELEVLGTPGTDNFNKPEYDKDKGRFNIFPIAFYEDAFKTPTVRNASATAPYMHNGSMATLEKVMEFYNKGGGNGLGLQIKNQTLSSVPLELNNDEISDIVGFIHSLEDAVSY